MVNRSATDGRRPPAQHLKPVSCAARQKAAPARTSGNRLPVNHLKPVPYAELPVVNHAATTPLSTRQAAILSKSLLVWRKELNPRRVFVAALWLKARSQKVSATVTESGKSSKSLRLIVLERKCAIAPCAARNWMVEKYRKSPRLLMTPVLAGTTAAVQAEAAITSTPTTMKASSRQPPPMF